MWACRATSRGKAGPSTPLPANVVGELLIFKCEKCDKESKTIVQG
jgi:hypothetical protein